MTDSLWRRTTLIELVQDAIGGLWGSPPETDNPDETDALVVRGADFRQWRERRAQEAVSRRIPMRSLERRQLAAGDLVIEVSGGGPSQPVGRVLVIDEQTVSELTKPLVCSNFCRKLRLRPGANPYFIKRQLDWLYQSGHMDRYQTSTTNIRNLQVDDFLAGTEIWLPDAKVQSHLSSLIEAVEQRQLDAAAHIETARRAIERFRRAALEECIVGLANDEVDTHPRVAIEGLLTSLGQGWSPQCLNRSASDAEEWAVIKTTAVQPLHFDWAENKVLPEELPARPHLAIAKGDILVTRAGPRSRVGISCLVETNHPRLLICDKVYRLRVDEARVDPAYLALVLNSPTFLETLEGLKTGTSESGMNLTQRGFKSLMVPLPSLDLQRLTVNRVTTLLGAADNALALTAQASQRLDRTSLATIHITLRGALASAESV